MARSSLVYWAAMLDLKAHAFRGRTFLVPDGLVLVLEAAATTAVKAIEMGAKLISGQRAARVAADGA